MMRQLDTCIGINFANNANTKREWNVFNSLRACKTDFCRWGILWPNSNAQHENTCIANFNLIFTTKVKNCRNYRNFLEERAHIHLLMIWKLPYLLQEIISSLPSEQSASPSHAKLFLMHNPFLHLNSPSWHLLSAIWVVTEEESWAH